MRYMALGAHLCRGSAGVLPGDIANELHTGNPSEALSLVCAVNGVE